MCRGGGFDHGKAVTARHLAQVRERASDGLAGGSFGARNRVPESGSPDGDERDTSGVRSWTATGRAGPGSFR